MSNKPYDVKPVAETGWAAWQTALSVVLSGVFVEYTGMSNELAVSAGTFLGVTSRPVLGYLSQFLPQRKS